ncbi:MULTISPECIES: hypothetical protein [unclassified Prosthecochloris]|uniref:hypothetical protein n=1 Tax=unclassified Prosthecochloris TaxID=2632826 RepID=UPI00223DE4DB|nr:MULTISPECIES: hypothetical protein [unclassified Prosthecochloris]UZJ37175.1 hypothetical protein OO005_10525 [Prosthecochloris sp. SCSIO W1103]UZJ38989.1 hypothetical protein OO185_03370 [Prosthecochloris sp. SCSIO W1102]
MYYIVRYSGPFGFIKPWTAVRDSETFSQQFLTPSIVTGIERKLFPELLEDDDGEIKKIVGHRLSYKQISQQQEQIQPRGWNEKGTRNNKSYERPYAILVRGVMLEPVLFLAFQNSNDAKIATKQHICLSRNEDLLYPSDEILEVSKEEFDSDESLFSGFELIFEKNEQSFLVGYNRYKQNEKMFGYIKIVGTPVKNNY